MKRLLLPILLLAGLVTAYAASNVNFKADEIVSKPDSWAKEMYEKKEENEIAFNKQYEGKFFQVSGKIESISRGYLYLEGGISCKVADFIFGATNYSQLEKNNQNILAARKKGDTVTVVGKYLKVDYNFVEKRENLLLSPCEVK